MFAKIVDGVVAEVLPWLPENTESVSGFNLLSADERRKFGYYPLVEVRPEFDKALEKIDPTPVYAIGEIIVTATYNKVLLTTQELDAITLNKRQSVQSQIDALEGKTLMNRFVREAMILISQQQAAALGLTEPQLYTANFGYRKVKSLDDSIVALRVQVEAIK